MTAAGVAYQRTGAKGRRGKRENTVEGPRCPALAGMLAGRPNDCLRESHSLRLLAFLFSFLVSLSLSLSTRTLSHVVALSLFASLKCFGGRMLFWVDRKSGEKEGSCFALVAAAGLAASSLPVLLTRCCCVLSLSCSLALARSEDVHLSQRGVPAAVLWLHFFLPVLFSVDLFVFWRRWWRGIGVACWHRGAVLCWWFLDSVSWLVRCYAARVLRS